MRFPPVAPGVAVLLTASLAGAATFDCGAGGKAKIFDRLQSVGTARINYRSTAVPCIQKGPAGTTSQISGTFDILYLDTPGSAQGAFIMPAPWFLNDSTRARYLNKDAPSGPGEARLVGVKAEKLARFGSRGLGDTTEIDISSPPGPGGVLAILSVHNAVDGNTYRTCTKWSVGSGSVIRYYDVDGGLGHKLFLTHGVVAPCSVVPTTTSTSTSLTTTTSTSLTTTTSTSSTTSTSTSTTSTTSTSTSTTSTTSTTLILSFVTGAPGGTCGAAKSGGSGGAVVKSLSCGGLNIGSGGGPTTVPEGPTPGGAETQFNASGGPAYTLSARTLAQTGSNNNCSDTGCNFGTWLPISGVLSTCVRNTFSSPASGSLNGTSGAMTANVVLSSAVYLTNNTGQPCPLCIGGTVGVTNSGMCDPNWKGGAGLLPSPDAGNLCTPTDIGGHNYECGPKPVDLNGTIPVNLSPLTTGTASKVDGVPGPNLFCPGQTVAGAFGQTTADYIEENGNPMGPVTASPTPTVLASVFCITSVGGAIDTIAGLPGPGATSLPGTLTLLP
jgi:hypothetical protein